MSSKKATQKKKSVKPLKNVLVMATVILATVLLIWNLLGFFGLMKESSMPLENFLSSFLPGLLFFIVGAYIVIDKNPLRNTKIFGVFLVVFSLLFLVPSLQNLFTQLMKPSPDGMVETFYGNYLYCQNKYFATSHKEICTDDQSASLTTSLTTKLQKARGYDPILCAQNTPAKISFDRALVNGENATMQIHTHWGSSPKQTITVGLNFEQNQWKIASITCP